MVLDGWSRMSEITEEGVSVVENLELERQPMPSTEAIYLISPTVSSYVLLSRTTWKKRIWPHSERSEWGHILFPQALHVYWTSPESGATVVPIKGL